MQAPGGFPEPVCVQVKLLPRSSCVLFLFLPFLIAYIPRKHSPVLVTWRAPADERARTDVSFAVFPGVLPFASATAATTDTRASSYIQLF